MRSANWFGGILISYSGTCHSILRYVSKLILMITLDKIDLYIKFDGDDDMLARAASKLNKEYLTDDDWTKITVLLQHITLMKRSLASQEFIRKTNEMLIEQTDCKETVARLMEYAERNVAKNN